MTESTTEWGVRSPSGHISVAVDEAHADELTAPGGIREGWTKVSQSVTRHGWSPADPKDAA